MRGIPKLKVVSLDVEIFVQHYLSGFITWIAENKEITHEITMGSIKFFTSEKELVGILSENTQAISN
ncbi:hypothetical protein D3C74_311600 [compost metagenome]